MSFFNFHNMLLTKFEKPAFCGTNVFCDTQTYTFKSPNMIVFSYFEEQI